MHSHVCTFTKAEKKHIYEYLCDSHFVTSKTRGDASGVLVALLLLPTSVPCSRGVVGATRGAQMGNTGCLCVVEACKIKDAQ
jgi:hypothetical protein